jgi:hypothetical protein
LLGTRCRRSQGHGDPKQTKEFPPLHFRSTPKKRHHMAHTDLLEGVMHRRAANVPAGSFLSVSAEIVGWLMSASTPLRLAMPL